MHLLGQVWTMCVLHKPLWHGPQLKGCPQQSNLKQKAWERTENTKDNSLKIISQPVVFLSRIGSHKWSLSRFKIKKEYDLFRWNIIYSDMITSYKSFTLQML